MSQARENSTLVSAARELGGKLGVALERSRLTGAGETLGRWVRGSYLYRWLTAEPDPDVIVIDLRETYTVGPVIAGLDRAGRFVADTRAGQAGADGLATLSAAVERRPVRVASIVVLVALLTNTLVSLALDGFTRTGLALRLFALGAALLGTRSSATAADLADSWLWELLAPPAEPERERVDDGSEDTEATDTDDATAEPRD
jgi:hypothetical protein